MTLSPFLRMRGTRRDLSIVPSARSSRGLVVARPVEALCLRLATKPRAFPLTSTQGYSLASSFSPDVSGFFFFFFLDSSPEYFNLNFLTYPKNKNSCWKKAHPRTLKRRRNSLACKSSFNVTVWKQPLQLSVTLPGAVERVKRDQIRDAVSCRGVRITFKWLYSLPELVLLV